MSALPDASKTQAWSARPRFEDRVVVITAAAAGIGAAAARLMAAEGGRIVAVDANADALDALLAELPGGPGRHAGLVIDCLDEDAVRQGVAAAMAHGHGAIDVLVNGVGGSTVRPLPAGGLEAMPLEDWNRLVQFNLTPTFLFCKHAIPSMKARRAGKIVNLSSIAARGADARVGNTAYSTSKAGVSAFTRRVAQELAPYGINCNAVAPGVTQTPRILRYYQGLSPEARAQRMAQIPLGRAATPEDQANAIAFLASSHADFITGVVLDVTGGE